jgi:hypothetical protein
MIEYVYVFMCVYLYVCQPQLGVLSLSLSNDRAH